MNDGLKKIIESSSFKVHDGEWVYAKMNKAPQLEDCFMASTDQDEITACFKKEDEEKFDILEKNKDLRKLIEIKVSAPFYAVGFLAAVTGAISAKG